MKKIVIDCTAYSGRITGLERYVFEIYNAMQKELLSDHKVFLLISPNNPYRYSSFLNDMVYIIAPRMNRILVEQLWIPYIIHRVKPEIVFFPGFPPSPIVFFFGNIKVVRTIFDAVMWKEKKTLSWKNRLYMKPLESIGIRYYDTIHTISEFSKRELVSVFPSIENKIVVSGIGVDIEKFEKYPISVSEDLNNKCNEPFLLFVGTIEPRKNIPFLIDVFFKVQASIRNLKLIIAGRPGWGIDEVSNRIDTLNISDRVVITGQISDDELIYLYHKAIALVYPSMYEGFGLPVIEAMASGLPVISSNGGALPEVVGSSGIIIEHNNLDDWVECIVDMINHPSKRDELIERGFKQAGKYTWKNTANNILRTL